MDVQQIIESLRPYAGEPPRSAPPEILPWDHDDPWGLDGAARATLGVLVAGEGPGERLYQMADYLLAFCIEGYGPRQYPDAFLLNGTALALCGYLCEGQHPEAELWRVTGCARLATEAHWRKAALSDRLLADCVLAVCRVADELDLPILADLITLRERIWGTLLPHDRAERLGVSQRDYPSYMSSPVPADQVGKLVAGRTWQCDLAPSDFFSPEVDLAEADQTCENLITLRAHMMVRHQFGSDVDWHLRLFDDIESTVSLNAQPFLRNLAAAYGKTGDAKYARHCARLLWSFYRQAPLPNHRQLSGPWRTLEVGNRQANAWPAILACAGTAEGFDEDTHAMLARSRLDHMRYATAFCGGANNWYQVEAAGLAVAALFSPELRHADAYLRIALRRLQWINSFAYYDDGFQFELSPGYHVFPTSSMFSVVQAARVRGVTLPQDFVALIERAHEMYLYAVQPDHHLPTFNDCGAIPTDPAPLLERGAAAFGRADFEWGATRGDTGQAPDHASHAWPSAGYYVMRDSWADDAGYLFFDGAAWGASHQHEDKLTFLLHAYGRLLISDPNIYSYSRTELTHYFRSSRAHNVVLIDGKGQARRFRPEARLSTLGQNEWVSKPAFDFVSSEYLEGYAPDLFGAQEPVKVDEGFSHKRAIFYVKGEYWILSDLIRGEDSETHTLEQVYHIAPIYQPGCDEAFRAGKVSVSPASVVTQDEGLANLAIVPLDVEGLGARAQKGEVSPAVGWYGVLGEFPAWDVTLQCTRTLPARMDAVLYPLAPGQADYPAVHRLHADEHVTALQVTGAETDDTYILCEANAGPVTVGDIAFEGRALLLRRKPALEVYAVEAESLIVGGRPITPE
ncbi:MAG: alginate lyase family protein [Anaerolineae bacterium]